MYHGVKSVQAAAGHKLILGFDNGECRVFDVRPLLSMGRFRELTSPEAFRKVGGAFDTIQWENGLDLDRESLPRRGEPIQCEQAAAAAPPERGAAEP